ncbi:MAG: VRR-NUC domain-containing protein, partial [Verrucomicrobiota bacterium]
MSSPSTIVLKSHYYLDHFLEMIEFVGKQYTHAFEPVHDRFLKDFSALSRDGQSLYVRVANRKGHVLPRRSLRYDEIGSIDRAISELSESRFLRSLERKDFPRLLALQKKEELVRLVRSNEACASVPPISARKRKWIEYALANLDWESCFPQTTRESFVVQDRTEELDYFLFLYFGQLSPNLQSFTLRDLGLIRTNEEKTTFSSRFENREIALAAFRYTRLLESLSDKSPEELLSLADQAQSWLPSPDIEIEDRRNRLIRKLGRELERVEKPERALEVYSHSDRFPSTERRVRLLHQDGRVTEVSRLLEKMIENPSCDEELLFAEDFYRRKFQQQRVGRLTSLLRSARELPLDESGRGASENAAARFLASDGIEAHHVENAIWSQLFALLFWDLLFGPDSKHLHSSFDRSPSGLNSGRFFSDHEKEIQRRIAGLDSPDEAIRKLEESFAHADEIPLSLCSLSPDLFALTRRLVLESPRGALAEILEPMTKNHREARRGFPDLILFGDEGVSFLEIKTEGDQIRRHQLVQIERLIAAGFPVEVARVRWIVDPEQEYVVVDVETTGGKAEWNRFTENGAVKMKGGRL